MYVYSTNHHHDHNSSNQWQWSWLGARLSKGDQSDLPGTPNTEKDLTESGITAAEMSVRLIRLNYSSDFIILPDERSLFRKNI